MTDALFGIGELSRRTGVSADVIRAWERRYGVLEPARSAGNFRLYTRDDVARLRLMRHYTAQNIRPSQAARLVRDTHTAALDHNPGVPDKAIATALAILERSLERFDAGPAARLLARLGALFTPAVILRDVVLPYLRALGERWECGAATVAQEHFASCFFEGWMLAAAGGWGRNARRRAVLACVPGEQHALGLTAFGIALLDRGWSVTFLGRDTPLDAARFAADAVGAEAIVLAAVMPEPLERIAAPAGELAESHPVVVGGPPTARGAPAQLRERILPPDVLTAAQVLTLRATRPSAVAG